MLLAISVLASHLHGKSIFGFRLVYGSLAVQCFFMISGFYMALVLNEKYNRRSDYIPFLMQRFLRLFPAYFCVLLLTVLLEGVLTICYGKPQGTLALWFEHAGTFSPSTWISMILSNLFLIGQELNLFQCLDPTSGNLYFTDHPAGKIMAWPSFVFVSQAWTLSLELIFYLLAPLLVRTHFGIQVLLVLASVALRLTTSALIDPAEYPWHMNHFFPYELAFFMAGSVGYCIYRHQKKWLNQLSGFTSWFRWVFYILILYYSRLPGSSYTREAILLPVLFIMIPILFNYTKNNETDRLIGELSYPFYLIHLLILFLMWPWLSHYVPPNSIGPIFLFLSIGASYLVYRGIDEKIDNYRHRLFEKERAAAPRPDLALAK